MPFAAPDPEFDWMPFFAWIQAHARVLYAAAVGAVGLMVGSFLNVAIYRWPRGLNLVRPASSCPGCGRPIRARDNVPVLGWLLLGGKCRDCRRPISARYPLVEALNGGLWAAAGWWGWSLAYEPSVNAGLMLTFLTLISLLVTASFIDIDVQLLPDEATLGGAVFMLAASGMWPELHVGAETSGAWWFPDAGPRVEALIRAGLGMAAGAGAVYAVTLAGTRVFARRIAEIREQGDDPEFDSAVGLGDSKLMLLIGAYLGPWRVLTALLLAVYAAGLGGVLLKWFSGRWPEGAARWRWSSWRAKWGSGNPVMALGPYLALGALIASFGGDALVAWMWSLVLPQAG